MSTSPKCYLKARASETAAMLKTLDELGCEWLKADRDDLLSIDLNFRPDAYFGTSKELLANVFGDERKELMRAELAAGKGTEIPASLFASELSAPGLRNALGLMNPQWMGGEYLPPLLKEEVEIARVRLDSTTGDVISIRAHPNADGIHYRVVDEYMDMEGHTCKVSPVVSTGPLTMGELVGLIDSADDGSGYGEERGTFGLVAPHWIDMWDDELDFEAARLFTRVRSEFYPKLEAYYDLACAAWCAPQCDPDDE